MKRKILLTAISFFLFILTYSQERIEKYCEVQCYQNGLFTNDFTKVKLLFGENEKELLNDETVNEMKIKLKECKTGIDIINCMRNYNWIFVSSVKANHNSGEYFYFKKNLK